MGFAVTCSGRSSPRPGFRRYRRRWVVGTGTGQGADHDRTATAGGADDGHAAAGTPADDERWAYELKWDGVRAVAYVEGGRVALMSRNDRDMARSYRTRRARRGVGERRSWTGRSSRCGRDGPTTALLQSRMNVQRPSERLVRTVPVAYYVFDLLHLGERSLLAEPYTARRASLARLGLDADQVFTSPGGRAAGRPSSR